MTYNSFLGRKELFKGLFISTGDRETLEKKKRAVLQEKNEKERLKSWKKDVAEGLPR